MLKTAVSVVAAGLVLAVTPWPATASVSNGGVGGQASASLGTKVVKGVRIYQTIASGSYRINLIDDEISAGTGPVRGTLPGVKKPSKIRFGVGNEFRNLRWQSWGGETAVARGRMRVGFSGRWKPVQLALGRPRAFTCGADRSSGYVQISEYTLLGWKKGFKKGYYEDYQQRGRWNPIAPLTYLMDTKFGRYAYC